MTVHGYQDLEVWKRAMTLVIEIYALTKKFPKEELFTLINQIRRSAISIPSNIAEGRAKRSTRDFIRFLNIAYGSAAELETQLLIGEKLGYASPSKFQPVIEEIHHLNRMMNGMLTGLEKKLGACS